MSEVLTVEISSILPHPSNPRKGDVPAIMRSLERFGQVKPVIVQKSTGYVVAGNHTVRAAKELGWATVKAIILDLDDETARAYLIADNRTGDKATYDEGKLLDLLSGALDLEGTGFDIDDVETLADSVGANTREVTEVGADGTERKMTVPDSPVPEGTVRRSMREVVLLYTSDDATAFAGAVRKLQGEYGTTAIAATVLEALRRATVEEAEPVAAIPLTGGEF